MRDVVVVERDVQRGATLDFVVDEPGFVVGRLERLCVLRTRAPLSIPAFDALIAEVRAAAAATGPNVATVIIPGAPEPAMTQEARAHVVRTWPLLEDNSSAITIWIRQGSFAGAIQQSIATAVLLMIAKRKPVKVCSKAVELQQFFVEKAPSLHAVARDWPAALDQFAFASDPPGVRTRG